MGIITVLQLYCSFWYATFLILTKSQIDYKVFVMSVAILAVLYYVRDIIQFHYIEKRACIFIGVAFFILLLFFLTPLIYGYQDHQYRSYLLVFLAQTLPLIILASNNANKDTFIDKIDSLSPVLSIVFTAIAIYAITHQRTYSGGGGMSTEFYLDYQNTSYIAAYASNFALYELLFGHNKNRRLMFATKMWIIVFIIDFALMIGAGGRGGFVTFLLINLLIVLLYLRVNKTNVGKPLLFAAFVIILCASILPSLLNFLQNNDFTARGFNKIFDFLVTKNSSGRTNIYKDSIQVFFDSPLWGHGIGSVFYELGYYSHNLFTDCLIELGLFGAIPLAGVLIATVKKEFCLIKHDEKNIVLLLLFLQGLLISMFSGYYLAQFQLIGLIVIILMRNCSLED